MPRVVIDSQKVEVPAGNTILDAARKLGLDIPALCHLDGHPPGTSCMLCLVRVKGRDRLVPSCATLVEEGMEIESESAHVRSLRRTGLELLLADHAGDCIAPCQNVCPAGMDIPSMLRQIAGNRWDDAIVTIRKDIALPAILGRACPELCERGCRLGDIGRPASICMLKRFVADRDLASSTPHLPACQPPSGKSVAILGAGPTGLAAAYHLLLAGHACTLFDERGLPGGSLRTEFDSQQLPPEVIDAEVGVIARLGAGFRMGVCVGRDVSLAGLREEFDAVLVAVGKVTAENAKMLDMRVAKDHLLVNRQTQQTELKGVFAAGRAARPGKLVVRNVADGKRAAVCIDQYLSGVPVTGPQDEFHYRLRHVDSDEATALAPITNQTSKPAPPPNVMEGLTPQQAMTEAARCLHCDCALARTCRLRHYARVYGANPDRYQGGRKTLRRHLEHADVIYEPGKCILCGLCVQIASEAGEPLGLTFVGRGFDVRVEVPFNRSIADGLQHAARLCAEACPTGALVLRTDGCQAGLCGSVEPPRGAQAPAP
ncbi:MAG: (2Fe-2S)-binding protein [Phycisphaerales bacterium]|nr:MAG: (2Fe-2S)-binding protein [Phycisphaerales bacterium]